MCANTERLLTIFRRTIDVHRHVLRARLGRRAPSRARAADRRARATKSRRTATRHRLVYDQTPAAFREDVRRAKALLEDRLGRAVLGYRAPSYSVTPRSLWALDILIEEGYRYDASIFPIRHDRYGIPAVAAACLSARARAGALIEARRRPCASGPSICRSAGGGYFRILPVRLDTLGHQRVNRLERRPAIFYLHPWEIDPGSAALRKPALSRFRHYRNLDETEARLRQLLTIFDSAPMTSIASPPGCACSNRRQPPCEPLPYLW